jgi:16S rRNA (uracil1498-N3)-methyltransferase
MVRFTTRRIYVDAPLGAGEVIGLDRSQSNYLFNVLRLEEESYLLVFNGRDGEWSARIKDRSRKSAAILVEARTRDQQGSTNLHYLFAPLKQGRLDYMVQKAVEMGASRLVPVITRRTQIHGVSSERMRANVVEAAEQCGILALPEIAAEIPFDRLIGGWSADRLMIFCDEDAGVDDPIAALSAEKAACAAWGERPPLAVLIGPEGGFDQAERDRLLQLPRVVRLSLGPRILRADTAAVAALAHVQAVLGDMSC